MFRTSIEPTVFNAGIETGVAYVSEHTLQALSSATEIVVVIANEKFATIS